LLRREAVRLERALPLSRRRDRHAGQALLRDAPPPSFLERRATLTEAIEYERGLLAEVQPLGFSFDTSDLPAAALRRWIKDFISIDATRLTLLLESFGYKHGMPLDADLVFDIRCLPNPHYEPLLQPLTGRDRAVVDFSKSCRKSNGCTTTSTISSAAGCPTMLATIEII
jgi:RNase adaptor protein for sRNA GlmZ degradation